MAKFKSKDICVGSGKFYMLAVTDANKDTMPDMDTIKGTNDANCVGNIESGFHYWDKIEDEECSDDLGLVSKSEPTKEDSGAGLGLITWNGKTLATVHRAVSYTENKTTKKRETLIGGLDNDTGAKYWCGFEPKDKDRIQAIRYLGQSTTSLETSFEKGNPAKIDPQFKALPFDDKGHRFSITEKDDDIAADYPPAAPSNNT